MKKQENVIQSQKKKKDNSGNQPRDNHNIGTSGQGL